MEGGATKERGQQLFAIARRRAGGSGVLPWFSIFACFSQ